jgi:integrase
MARRGENVYKRKDGRWEGRVLGKDGKYRYFYATSYRQVKEKIKNASEQQAVRQVPKNTGAVELFDTWVRQVQPQVKPTTFENYESCIRRYVIPFFEQAPNKTISVKTVTAFVQHIEGTVSLSPTTKKKILTIFKTALRAGLKSMPQRAAILEAVVLPKTETKEVQVFSMAEQRQIETAVYQTTDTRALGIVLCFYTGIRLGELCALRWGDIDLEAGTMNICRTVSRTRCFEPGGPKTMLLVGSPKSRKSARKIPLPAFLLQLIQQHWRNVPDHYYVVSGKEVPIDPRSYEKIYKNVLSFAGVKDRKFHAIRHTFATRALELGVDIKTISEILGHSGVSVTLNIYAHSMLEQKKKAIDKFNQMHVMHMEFAPFAGMNSALNMPKECEVRRAQ